METGLKLEMGVNVFSPRDLIEKAARHKGLTLVADQLVPRSAPIKRYQLTKRQLAALSDRGIKRQFRPDCRDEIFTLVDENPQEKIPGFAVDNFWNFKLVAAGGSHFDLGIRLQVEFSICLKKRGIVFTPRAYGTFLSPVSGLPHFRMFQALVESDSRALSVAKEIAHSNGNILVGWTELGLGGIRHCIDLFAEFAGQNEEVRELGRSGKVFGPDPSADWYISEPVQSSLFETWEFQLENYRARLAV